jgi:hypothetical protein
MGLSPISRTEIAQWEADEGVVLERWERRAILRIDAAYRDMTTARDDAAEQEEEAG